MLLLTPLLLRLCSIIRLHCVCLRLAPRLLKLPQAPPLARLWPPLLLPHVLLSSLLIVIMILRPRPLGLIRRLLSAVRILASSLILLVVFTMPSKRPLSDRLSLLYIRLDILCIELFGKRISADSVVFRAFSFAYRVADSLARAREAQHSFT